VLQQTQGIHRHVKMSSVVVMEERRSYHSNSSHHENILRSPKTDYVIVLR